MAKKKWAKRTLKLKPDHGWTCRDGYNIFVADRGAVRFDIPRGWAIEPGERGSVKILDKPSPRDDCCLEMTIFYLNDRVDWSGLPIVEMLAEITGRARDEADEGGDEPPKSTPLWRGEVEQEARGDMQMAWRQARFLDHKEDREAFSYTLVARRWNIMPLITFAYWVDDAARVEPAWREVLRTLTLGDYVEDPTQRLNDV